MLVVLRRFYILITSLVMVLIFASGVLLFGQPRLSLADEFDDLLGEAVTQGTQVDAARSRKDAAESSIRKAWSKFLPSINARGEFGHSRDNALGRMRGGRSNYDSSEYGVSATLPIYRGGENYYGLKEARANAKAEGHSYKETKQLLLLETARAILGIIRDREIVSLQRQNQRNVASILEITQSRYRGGEATRTDIAIAEDQYTAAQSVYTQAVDNLRSNETEFLRIIGRKPGRLSLPKGLERKLPRSLNQAIALAQEQNPQLLAALFRSKAAQHSVKASYSGILPKVDLNMDYTEERYHGENLGDESDLTVKLNFTVPLFQPEALATTQVSKHVSEQRKHEARDARLSAKAMATIAWRSFHTAKKRHRLGLVRIKAARAAARGMRRELEAGQRTVLDVLDTQERLVQARVGAAEAKYEKYMSAHLLLSSIGELDVGTEAVDGYGDYVRLAEKKQKSDGQWRQSSLHKTVIKQAKAEKNITPKTDKKTQLAALGGHKIELPEKLISEPWTTNAVATEKSFSEPEEMKLTALPKLKERPAVIIDEGDPVTETVKKSVIEKTVIVKPAVVEGGLKVIKDRNESSAEIKSKNQTRSGTETETGKEKSSQNKKVEIKADLKSDAAVKTVTSHGIKPERSETADHQPDLKKTDLNEMRKDDALPLKKLENRNSVYSKVLPKSEIKSEKNEELVTGSITKEQLANGFIIEDPVGELLLKQQVVDKAPVQSSKVVVEKDRTTSDIGRKDVKVAQSQKQLLKRTEPPKQLALVPQVKAFSVHMIPLPTKKPLDTGAELVTGSVASGVKRTDVTGSTRRVRRAPVREIQPGKRKAEKKKLRNVYPATMRNKFAVWWNDKIDKVIGSDGRPKPKLISVDQYRRLKAEQ